MLDARTTALELDADGYLLQPDLWDEQVALRLALSQDIELTADHWQIIYAVRDFYQEFQLAPANRALVKFIAQRFGADVGNSLYLNSLFAGKPAKLAALIAGLPKPANCF